MKKHIAGCVLAALATSGAFAQNPAINSWTGGSLFATYHGNTTGDVVGFRFTMVNTMLADSLGIYCGGATGAPDGSIAFDHQVGIWRDSDQSLVASATVLAGTSVDAFGFGYVGIAPVQLDAGSSYTLGAMYVSLEPGDGYISSATSVSTSSDITFLGAVRPELVSMGFAYPTNFTAGANGRFGPNMTMTAVPEPGTLVAIAFGLGAFALARRRR